jgi:hypothetical protein
MWILRESTALQGSRVFGSVRTCASCCTS